VTQDDGKLGIGQVARELGVSVDTVRRWEAAGKIIATRNRAGQRRFTRTEIDRLLGTHAA
jgi:putative resolvase